MQRCNRRNVGTSWAQTSGNRYNQTGSDDADQRGCLGYRGELPILAMKPNRLELNQFEAVLVETKREGWRD